MKKITLCAAALCLFTGCPAEETNNGEDAGNNVEEGNPAECPKSPPTETVACVTEGIACTYTAACPCGPEEDFVWTCTGGNLEAPPSIVCSTGPASACEANNVVTGDMGSVPDMAGPVDMAADMPPDMAMPRLEAHNCTYAAALDMTGMATVVLSDLMPWDLTHTNVCIRVDAGTVVTWAGDFTVHPLAGGVSPTAAITSPITIAAQGANGNGDGVVDATLTVRGDYPYFCTVHTGVMRGVIYVD